MKNRQINRKWDFLHTAKERKTEDFPALGVDSGNLPFESNPMQDLHELCAGFLGVPGCSDYSHASGFKNFSNGTHKSCPFRLNECFV
jgi:hypothetical protein